MRDKNKIIKKSKASGGFRKLLARTKKAPRKQRAVATAHHSNDEEDKSNIVGILIFLVIVHAVAILACIFHQNWTKNDVYTSPTPENHNVLPASDISSKSTMIANEKNIFAEPKLAEPNFKIETPSAGIIPTFAETESEDKAESLREESIVVKAQPRAKVSIYTVKSGDTVQTIAVKFRMKTEDLELLNSLESARIYVGQKLYIKQ